MSSTASRGDIVLNALSLAGRSTELKASANAWLNLFLLHVGLNFRFPELRKIGATSQLAAGSQTAALPSDMGVGMEKSGMIFGPDSKPMSEYSYEDFAYNNGFPTSSTQSGRPYFYMVDKNAGNFRFSCPADQAYSFTPVYFINPPLLDPSFEFDSQKIWLSDDLLAIEGLIWMIYKFKEDEREDKQYVRVMQMLNDWKREQVKMGGTSRVMPSPNKFKNTKFGGFYGP